jgi:hypothetical protein
MEPCRRSRALLILVEVPMVDLVRDQLAGQPGEDQSLVAVDLSTPQAVVLSIRVEGLACETEVPLVL